VEWLSEGVRLGLAGDAAAAMRAEWLAALGALTCARCGREIEAGEQFVLRARCTFGGIVPLTEAAQAYADTLEPYAEHLDCATSGVME
jgi:hypothetical protein